MGVRTITLGIDPGIHGALALIDYDGLFLEIWDMPSVRQAKGNVLSATGIRNILSQCFDIAGTQDATLKTYVEEQHARPIQGVTSAFAMGRNFGVLEVALDLRAIPWRTVRPSDWKKSMGVSKDKNSSLMAARRLWPQAADHLNLAKHDGRAEALLIAEWGRTKG